MILYLGNDLTLHGNTPSSIATLGKLLQERYEVVRYSSKQNQFIRALDMMIAIMRFRKVCRVVLIDTYSSLAFYYAAGAGFLCRFFRVPYIPILRGGNLQERLSTSPRLSKNFFGGADVLVSPSGFMVSIFEKHGYENIRHIPNSIEMKLYDFKERSRILPRLLWVRSFHEVYNPKMAIEVMTTLATHFPHPSLCMVGPDKDGSLAKCREYAQAAGFTDQITFTGVLSKKEWHALAGSYDVFINTTTIDNTPVSVIEAMALGLPVVSTNVGGVPFLLKDSETGLLVDSGCVECMAAKIVTLVENPEMARSISVNARKHVEQFDWACVKYQWFELLDSLVEPSVHG